MEKGEDCEILLTNLQPFFWKKVKDVIRQNKKGAFQEFLFGSQLNQSINHSESQNDLEENIQILQNQLNSFQQKVEIIKLGFQLNQDGKISLKNYYQGKKEFTLFQRKGYPIKYDTIRKTRVYQQSSNQIEYLRCL